MNTEHRELEHKEITRSIIGAAFDVYRVLGIRVGLLINFGRTKVEFQRFVF